MRRVPIVVALGLFLAQCLQCSIQESEPEGTQTNWGVCDRDSECDAGFRCVEHACVVSSDASGDAVASSLDASGDANASSDAMSTRNCGAGEHLTVAEWEACIAVQPGPHDIDVPGCDETPIGGEYAIVPIVTCEPAPDYDEVSNRLLLCGVMPYCSGHEDCSEGGRIGHCTGMPSSECRYPGRDAFIQRPCSSDADCQDVRGAFCSQAVPDARACYPTGECVDTQDTCYLATGPCESDADCTAMPGGTCIKTVLTPQCEFRECTTDDECGVTERCGCHACVPASCRSDADCGEGTCRLSQPCGVGETGYLCSTPLDECASNDDCGDNAPCQYRGDRWQCGCLEVP